MLLRGKIGPENRVNIFLSYKSGIKKPLREFLCKTDTRNGFLIPKLVKIHTLHIDLLQIVFELNFHIAREGTPLKGLGKPP